MLNLLSRMFGAASPRAADDMPDIPELAEGPCQVIRNRRQIEHVLTGLAQAGQPVTIGARGQARAFRTQLTAVDPIKSQFLAKQLWNDREHRALMAGGHINLSAEHEGSPILFTLDILGNVRHEGGTCYRLPFPAWILSVQMRECLRVSLPGHLRGRLRFRMEDGLAKEYRILDLSEGGIGFIAPPATAQRFALGMCLKETDLLTASTDIFSLRLRIRHIRPLGELGSLVGVAIIRATESQLQALRRLILLCQSTFPSPEPKS